MMISSSITEYQRFATLLLSTDDEKWQETFRRREERGLTPDSPQNSLFTISGLTPQERPSQPDSPRSKCKGLQYIRTSPHTSIYVYLDLF